MYGKAFCFITLFALLAGCSPRPPALYPVRGTVTVNGKPASKVQVVFYRMDDPSGYPAPSSAMADENGAFELTTAKQADGALAGEYAVVFVWQTVTKISSDGEPTYAGPDKLGGRYGDRKSTPIRATVKAGVNEPLVFDLKR